MGTIVGLALKSKKRAPLELVDTMAVTEDGIVGNVEQTEIRRITLISEEQWAEVQREMSTEIAWETRRSNILVRGLYLPNTVGQTLKIGGITLKINGETKPCELMNTYCEGLMECLISEMRGGVYGSVVAGGNIALNDTISVVGES